jgi:Family of unknown function (DUF6186)
MAGNIAWAAIAFAGVAWQIGCTLGWTGKAGIGRVLGRLNRRLPGRLLLFGAWAFVGVHIFARYTLPGQR